jgi:hypothetical protein
MLTCMPTISRKVQWTVLAEAGDPLPLIRRAVEASGFDIVTLDDSSIVIEVPRAIIKNRWTASISGTPRLSERGTNIEWTVEGLGNKHFDHLSTLAEAMPAGSLYDHGIADAVGKIAFKIFGRKEIGHLANVLDETELVLAIGIGNLVGKMGIVAITDRRLIFFEKSIGSESLVDFAISSIGALSLGKKLGGETLTIAHSGTTATITTLQPGQGDAIVREFRALKEPGSSMPVTDATDPIERIERLAALRDRGILSEDEFVTQKTQILAAMSGKTGTA